MSTPKVYIRTAVDVIVDGNKYTAGSLHDPVSVDIAGDEITSDTLSIAVSTVVKVWDKDESGVGDFDFLYLACDRDLQVELTIDIGADVGTRLQTFTLLGSGTAGEMGLPFMLGNDAAFASDYTASFAAGTLDTIERIRVKNTSSTLASKLRRIIAS
jgi:hypothetical protein